MINSDKFSKRLEIIIQHYGESASSFSEKVGVQRSSISHILSGRNKPSLDFIMKILSAYPEVELYWLLNGKGQFPPAEKIEQKIDGSKNVLKQEPPPPVKENPIINLNGESTSEKEIERIVIFYKDGTFKNFNHSS